MEYNVSDILNSIDFKSNEFKSCKNGLMLTNKEIEVLDKYNINYNECSSLKELLCRIEEVFEYDDFEDLDDLDVVSCSISERDYYQNTNK